MTTINSIPHASSSGSNHNNGQKPISISPTNSTSPVISGLANDENTIPGQSTGSGDETILDCGQLRSAEKSVPDHEKVSSSGEKTLSDCEQLSASGQETVVVVDKATETTEEEIPEQGPTR